MPERLRTFVAFRCSEALSQRLRREVARLERLDDAFRGSGDGAFHLTVQFLGDTREDDVVSICRALAEAVRGSGPVDVRYGGLGAFPELERARVVWAAVADDPPDALRSLARAVGERLSPLGYPPEARAYTPHLTLGRVRGRPSPDLVKAVLASSALDLGGETLSDLKLILSRPEGGRYHYIDLTTVVLGSGPRA